VRNVEDAKNANSMRWIQELGGARQVDSLDDLKRTIASTETDGRLWDDYYGSLQEKIGTTTDKQIAAVDKWYADQVDKAVKGGTANQKYYDDLYTVAQLKMGDVIKLNDPMYLAHQKLLSDMKTDTDNFLGDVYGGFSKTFSTDIVKLLEGKGSFHDIWTNLWNQLETDVGNILTDLVNNVIQGFISKAEASLGGFLSDLVTGGSGSSGGGGGWAGIIAGIIGGHGHSGDPGSGQGDFGPPPTSGLPFGPGAGELPGGSAPGAGDYGLGSGGIVYARDGWMPRGIDTVRAMLAPGEGVLTREATAFVGPDFVNNLNRGVRPTASTSDGRIDALHATMKAQGERIEALFHSLPIMMRHAQRGTR
jgi:hypothetical protein